MSTTSTGASDAVISCFTDGGTIGGYLNNVQAGVPMSNVVNFPTKLSIDSMTAEERASLLSAVLDNTERFASAFMALEDEICDLTLMADIASALASELLNKPNLRERPIV